MSFPRFLMFYSILASFLVFNAAHASKIPEDEGEKIGNEKTGRVSPKVSSDVWNIIARKLDLRNIYALSRSHKGAKFLRKEYGFPYLQKLFHRFTDTNCIQGVFGSNHKVCKSRFRDGLNMLFFTGPLNSEIEISTQKVRYLLRSEVKQKLWIVSKNNKNMARSSHFYGETYPKLFTPHTPDNRFICFDFRPLLKAYYNPRIVESYPLQSCFSYLKKLEEKPRILSSELFSEKAVWEPGGKSLKFQEVARTLQALTKNIFCQKGALHSRERSYKILGALNEIPINPSQYK